MASTVNNPADFGSWISYTPTWTPGSGSFTTTTSTGAYKLVNKTLFFRGKLVITNAGTAAGSLTASLPTGTAAGDTAMATQESQAVGQPYYGLVSSGGTTVGILNNAGSTAIASGRTIVFSGSVELQ